MDYDDCYDANEPNEDDFERMYEDELELLNEIEFGGPPNVPVEKSLPQVSTSANGILSNNVEEARPALSKSHSLVSDIESVTNGVTTQSPKQAKSTYDLMTIQASRYESCKRSFRDLFGDVEDIQDDDDMPPSKKVFKNFTKMAVDEEVDEDMLIIEKILQERKRIEHAKRVTLRGSHIENRGFEAENAVLTDRVPVYAFVTIRCSDGRRLYAKLNSAERLREKIFEVSSQCNRSNLLAVPFEQVLNEAQALITQKWDKSERPIGSIVDSEDSRQCGQVEMTEILDAAHLWVEKYKPAHYRDLLSDEAVNRTLLKWLKLWDKIVFGKERKIKRKKEQKFDKFGKYNFQNRAENMLDEAELDENGCPRFKVAFLVGPPGLGKTTLAHLAAKQAGYNVVELNASDDRSPEIFYNQLVAATQMKAVMGADPRPNCLILDEIDGAPQASIDVVVKYALGKSGSKKKVGKKGAPKGILQRPIICICNDAYANALRPLRQIAFVLNFPSTGFSRLASRLVEIAHAEHIATDIGAMLVLCEKANADIRSCLSTMYCLKDKPIRVDAIRQTDVGSKDMTRGLFDIWQQIFFVQPHKTESSSTLIQSGNSANESWLSKRMRNILQNVYGSDYDRLMIGIYENFPSMKIKDTSMNAVSESLNWFCFYDQVKNFINKRQVYSVMGYLPYCFVTWHYVFSSYNKPKINFPSAHHEASLRESRYISILEDSMRGIRATLRPYVNRLLLLTDTMPLLMYVITPLLRPVNPSLYNIDEKNALNLVVNAMIDYNLTYTQVRQDDGGYEYIMDPNMEEVVKLNKESRWKSLSYVLKHSISREIEFVKMREIETRMSNSLSISDDKTAKDGNTDDLHMDVVMEEPVPSSSQSKATSSSQNYLQKLVPKEIIAKTSSRRKDFFGRITENSSSTNGKNQPTIDEIVKSEIWFHFKEGYSNAVRRTVYMKDL